MAISQRVTTAASLTRIRSRLDATKPASPRTAMPQSAKLQPVIHTITSRSPAPAYAPRPPVVLRVAAGLVIGNIYYNQPVFGLIAGDLRAGHAVSLLPTSTQAGYALGILLLVPLGDQVDRRRLILLQGAGLMGALAAAAFAPGLPSLIAASVLLGAAIGTGS